MDLIRCRPSQMLYGVPVAAVAVDNARNAGLLWLFESSAPLMTHCANACSISNWSFRPALRQRGARLRGEWSESRHRRVPAWTRRRGSSAAVLA